MSDVLVRGMKMPTCCYECELVSVGMDMYYCTAPGQNRKGYEFGTEMEIPKTCPLVELPAHGDLIDRDALLYELGSEHVGGLDAIKEYKGTNTWTDGLHTAWRDIDDAPVIIPAEGSDT